MKMMGGMDEELRKNMVEKWKNRMKEIVDIGEKNRIEVFEKLRKGNNLKDILKSEDKEGKCKERVREMENKVIEIMNIVEDNKLDKLFREIKDWLIVEKEGRDDEGELEEGINKEMRKRENDEECEEKIEEEDEMLGNGEEKRKKRLKIKRVMECGREEIKKNG